MAKRIIILHGARNNNYNVFAGFKYDIHSDMCVVVYASNQGDVCTQGPGSFRIRVKCCMLYHNFGIFQKEFSKGILTVNEPDYIIVHKYQC